MNIHKLGCNWGSNKPDFYDFLKEKNMVIGVSEKRYSKGDLVVLFNGFTAKAIVKITSDSQVVTNKPELKDDFQKYEIDFEDWVEFYSCRWYELDRDEQFTYKLQTGIVQIQKAEIKKIVLGLYKKTSGNKDEKDSAITSK